MKEARPPQFKTYAADPLPLPRDLPQSGTATLAALRGLPPSIKGPLDAALVARVLFYSAGVVRYLAREDGSVEWYRAAGSSGNLSPLEVYVVVGDLDGVPAGVYHYEPISHGLTLVRRGDARAAVARATASETASGASIVLTGVPWRTGWKYEERGFRNIYRDAGTMLSQLLAVAGTASATIPSLRLGFVDHALIELLGLDGVNEFPIAVVDLGPAGDDVDREPLAAARTGPLGPLVKEFRLVTAIQRAGDLADVDAVRGWRAAAARLPVTAEPGSEAVDSGETLEESIRRRGSTRRFRRETASHAVVEALRPALRPPGSDVLTRGTSLLTHVWAIHDIDGVDPGVYRHDDGQLELLRSGETRSEATALCLDQRLAGDGACALFHTAPLDPVLNVLGDRGYRVILIESGLAGGRAHLAARSCGLGATGLTFYDDVVRERWGLETYVQLVTAIGAPAYQPRPAGRPGAPTRLQAIPSTA